MRRIALLACFLSFNASTLLQAEESNPFDAFDTSKTFFLSSISATVLQGQLKGVITPQTLEEAKVAIKTLGDHGMISLDSPGGDVLSAMEIGRLIRARHALAVVPKTSSCASACILVLAGAADRHAIGSVIMHRPYFNSPRV